MSVAAVAPALSGAPTVTARIAEFVATYPATSIPDVAFDKAEKALLDTISCVLAGGASEEGVPLRKMLEGCAPGAAPIIAFPYKVDPPVAAMVNGTLGHALDYDDVLSIMPAHPSTVVLPALLALLPPKTNGRTFIDAYIIGLEVGARIGVAISNGHYRRGWHSTGTLAIFSAVAALGRLLRLSEEELATAFGMAGSMSSGLQCNFGTMTKPFHAGWASHSAVVAVTLARSGFSATPDVFGAPAGFFSTYGTEQSDVEKAAEGLGTPFAIVTPGLSLKKYPCCYALHRPIDAMLELRGKLGLNQENTESVVCRVAPGVMRPLIHSDPHTGLQAKFSLEYTLAAGILDGGFGLAAYSDAGVERPAIRPLYSRVSIVEDPRCLSEEPDPSRKSAGTLGFVEVTATRRDGESATVRIDKPTGSPQKELSWADLQAKFLDCAREAALPEAAAAKAFETWRHLRRTPDMSAAIALVQPGAA
jgi:2-methylcitrate dehydratase PrpD